MCYSRCNKLPGRPDDASLAPAHERGISLIEVMIAIFLTTVGILAILSMQPAAWQAASRSDYLGRAAELLYKELETCQAQILNPCNTDLTPLIKTNAAVRTSDPNGPTGVVAGDATYSVTTTITNIGTDLFRVTVRVSWNNNTRSITESLVVSRQDFFRFPPVGCT